MSEKKNTKKQPKTIKSQRTKITIRYQPIEKPVGFFGKAKEYISTTLFIFSLIKFIVWIMDFLGQFFNSI